MKTLRDSIRSPFWRAAFRLYVALVVAVAVLPFCYAVFSSLLTGSALADVRDATLAGLSFANYPALFGSGQYFGHSILNSLMVASAVVAASLLLGVTAAYALGRIEFRGRGLLLMAILAVSMFPQVAVLAGMYEVMRVLGLYNKALGLVLPYMLFTLPFTVWVLTTFMRELPKELEEAAIMDGCSPWRVLVDVFMPLLWPVLVSVGLLAFVAAWNEFLFALTFVNQDTGRTVPVAISLIGGGATSHELPWGKLMAASVLVTLPLVALVMVFQRKIVSGLTAGAVKG
ncbi:carbohydrate ABC transporter permease [Pseudoduganella namucuonensis]|uniref:Trehalose/maltose transport system permease protein n=1 Tax=Pseudoduganella namucuonensis TaxID=1035707 RepID=A0A1I7IZ08_9BURK|nr:carbohydrate ABC transporter permease [Pseudoduganella namucuonensis]SFU78160.1 trehalose/maltose transport system permease protein [Pseudoduganella namucuonensis]